MTTTTEVLDAIQRERVLDILRNRLYILKVAAGAKKKAEAEYQEVSASVKSAIREVDGENGNGVRFWFDGVENAAILSKQKPELSWNLEKLVPFLRETGAWDRVTTQVVDPVKLASEIAAGNIVLTEEQTAEFQYVSKDVAASVRFVNVTPKSI